MRIDVVTIFPDYLAPLGLSLVGRARESGLLDVRVHDLRDWTHDRHRTVDDTPYGGGAGMVMRPEPWGEALDALVPDGASDPADPGGARPRPGGRSPGRRRAARRSSPGWSSPAAATRASTSGSSTTRRPGCRSRSSRSATTCSAGGEVATLVIVEAVTRLLPGFLGNPESLDVESHRTGDGGGLLEHPVYTKPASWRGLDVPEVLLSGHHGKIGRVAARAAAAPYPPSDRPDLLR